MATVNTFYAGNVAKNTYTFVPESGSVVLADVTARLLKPNGTVVALTVTGPGPNTFRADWPSADTDVTGRYTVRWESNPGTSPKIVDEVGFNLIASAFAAP